MKKTIYGLLFLSLAGVISCDKESVEQNTEATTETRENLEKANVKNYAIGANPTSLQLLRRQYDIPSTSFLPSSTSLNDFLYYGVGAYDDDIAILGETGTGFSDIIYRSGIGNNKYGLVKLNGADFLLDEIELIDDDINKLYGLSGRSVYKLTYNTTTTNFDAIHLYTHISAKPMPRFTIAPVTTDNVSIRLYYATQTQLNYIDINTASQTLSSPATVSGSIPASGDLSSFTAKDYFYTPSLGSGYYVVFDKKIYRIQSGSLTDTTFSFDSPVNDCSFYAQ